MKAEGFSDPAMLNWTFENDNGRSPQMHHAHRYVEQEVPVRMTNFARILNELNSSFSGRNDVVDKLCRYPLLIIDDFGMERGTEYALEQIYSIVDSRYHHPRGASAAGHSLPVCRRVGHPCQKPCSRGQPQEVHAAPSGSSDLMQNLPRISK